ncbi:class I SAM-dependent methyltransferase [Staphylococcus delphini]|uniref:class I SAM-dependent methyltransferase n=1 Tax=Staphylococcus delphini TaxID=53344 RepID=UPI000BBC638D|nr:class I SAM-dependent methyltransferase [Staphylococcus delphini]PCF46778.1 hypothetical protein B5C09_09170 [Staphylococcus delphini]PCF74811.1 hypothetical protein B4W71_04250 [Staphylococcus delphini]
MLSKEECLAYDRLVKKYQSHIYPLIFFNTINDLKFNVNDKLEVLELGTGNGYLSNQFIKNTNFQVDSIDINEEMIFITENNFPENTVNYMIDDAHYLKKIGDESKDLIISYSCFHHWEYPVNVIKACLKKLNKKGVIVFFDTRPLNSEECRILQSTINEENQRALLLKASQEAWNIEKVEKALLNNFEHLHFNLNYFEPTAIDVASSIDELDTMNKWKEIELSPTLWRLVIKKGELK